MKATTAALLTVALLIPTLAVVVMLPKRMGLELLMPFLTFIAGVCAGFVLLEKRKREFALETAGMPIAFALAAAGLWVSPNCLTSGYIFHGVWDALHHSGGIQTIVPRGYEPFCMIFDLAVGIFVLLWWR